MWRIESRIERLNDMGFDVDELDIVTDFDGDRIRIQPKVVELGHHRRELQSLTGMTVEDNQARRLLNDLASFTAHYDLGREDRHLVAGPWMTQIYEPIMAMVPREARGKLEPAEIFHEILVHRWYLSERAGHEVGIFETARDYIDTVLAQKPDELIAAEADVPGGRLNDVPRSARSGGRDDLGDEHVLAGRSPSGAGRSASGRRRCDAVTAQPYAASPSWARQRVVVAGAQAVVDLEVVPVVHQRPQLLPRGRQGHVPGGHDAVAAGGADRAPGRGLRAGAHVVVGAVADRLQVLGQAAAPADEAGHAVPREVLAEAQVLGAQHRPPVRAGPLVDRGVATLGAGGVPALADRGEARAVVALDDHGGGGGAARPAPGLAEEPVQAGVHEALEARGRAAQAALVAAEPRDLDADARVVDARDGALPRTRRGGGCVLPACAGTAATRPAVTSASDAMSERMVMGPPGVGPPPVGGPCSTDASGGGGVAPA